MEARFLLSNRHKYGAYPSGTVWTVQLRTSPDPFDFPEHYLHCIKSISELKILSKRCPLEVVHRLHEKFCSGKKFSHQKERFALICLACCCSNYSDLLLCHRALVTRLLSQGYKVNRLSNTFKKFYGRHTDLVGQYKKNVCQMFADSISWNDFYFWWICRWSN